MSAETEPPRGETEPPRGETEPAAHQSEEPLWEGDEGAGSGSASPAVESLPQAPPYETVAPQAGSEHHTAPNMLPGRERRRTGFERIVVRVIATAGVVGIGVAIAAILASSKTQGWIIGLVVGLVSVVLSAVLWSSRQL